MMRVFGKEDRKKTKGYLYEQGRRDSGQGVEAENKKCNLEERFYTALVACPATMITELLSTGRERAAL